MKIHLILLTILLFTGVGFQAADGQPRFNLDKFDLFQEGSSVKIELIISSGNTCDGIYFYRSVDGENFQLIGQVNGTCGSPYYPVGYEFYDTEPRFNEINYYKVAFGGFGYTREYPIMVWDAAGSNSMVVPNPVSDRAKIFFHNPNSEEFRLKIFNGSGQEGKVHTTRTDYFEPDMSYLSSGLYHYSIQAVENERVIFSGTFILK